MGTSLDPTFAAFLITSLMTFIIAVIVIALLSNEKTTKIVLKFFTDIFTSVWTRKE